MWKKFKLLLSSRAKSDIENTVLYYESQQKGLGKRFRKDLKEKFELLQNHPEICAIFEDEVRKANLKIFPYSVYYEADIPEEVIDILAVIAQAQNPEEIQKELAKRKKK